jgi:hypothetical protein
MDHILPDGCPAGNHLEEGAYTAAHTGLFCSNSGLVRLKLLIAAGFVGNLVPGIGQCLSSLIRGELAG